MTGWSQALDEFEEHLDACRSLLDNDTDPDLRPWPPAELVSEALPGELVDRAQSLLYRATQLTYEVIDRQASLPELRPPSRRHRNPGLPTMSTEL